MRPIPFPRKGKARARVPITRAIFRRAHLGARTLLWLALAALLLTAAGLATRAVLVGRDPTWERIRQSGVWRVGMDPSFPPFESLDGATGKPVGLDVDLATAIAERWGVRAEIVGVGFDELIDAVSAYRVDSAISALPVLEHRTREVAFSAPYVEAGVLLVTSRENAIAKSDDLAGKRISAEWGSAGDAQARALQRRLGGNLTLVLRESSDRALQALLDGQADAAAVDAVSLALFAAGKERLVTVGEPLQSEPYVVVVSVHAPKLRAAVDEALAQLAADGTLDAIKARWLNDAGRGDAVPR
jgi:polar amino acid transport system substrate-binding protein